MATVEQRLEENVCTVTLNRPEKKNAMSLELLKELSRVLASPEASKAAIVVIRGAGGAFCAGGDVTEFRDSPDPTVQVDSMADYLNRSILAIRGMKAVVIAVVEGLAFGAGLSLALACDLVVAEKSAVVNMAYRRIGLTPDGGGSIFLPRLAGMRAANEFYFLSRNITPDEAKALGLVNFVHEKAQLEQKLSELLGELKKLPFETIGPYKELVNATLFPGLSTHLDKERRLVSEFAGTKEFKQRLEAMFKKG